jgi:hypothetical protein
MKEITACHCAKILVWLIIPFKQKLKCEVNVLLFYNSYPKYVIIFLTFMYKLPDNESDYGNCVEICPPTPDIFLVSKMYMMQIYISLSFNVEPGRIVIYFIAKR